MIFAEKTFNFIKETLFPVFCVGCESEGEWVCPKCHFTFDTNGIFLCPGCKEYTVFGRVCSKCKNKVNLSSLVGIFTFKKNPNISSLINIWKYDYAEELECVIDGFVQEFGRSNFSLLSGADAIVPIPLHPRRFAERGFNQAEIIAKSLSEVLDVPVINFLKRNRYTKQQAKLKKIERQSNVGGAFSMAKELNCIKKVILVDDVYTTGSTMNECAKVLREKGVEEVIGFVVVRG